MKLGRVSLIVAALLLWTSGASAQEVRGELIVGISRNDYRSQRWSDTDRTRPNLLEGWEHDLGGSIVRPVLGIAGAAQVLGPLWLRAEAVAVTKGYAGRHSSHRMLYLEVPMLLELTLPGRGDVDVRFVGGIAPSTEVSCSAHVRLPRGSMSWIGAPMDFPVACSRERQPNDLGGVFGIGFGAFTVGGVTFVPELRGVTGRVQQTENYRSRHVTFSTLLNVSW